MSDKRVRTFKQFLGENKTSWALSDFKAILASAEHVEAFDQRAAEALRTRYIPKLIELFNQYATGDVPNPVVNHIKDTANRVCELALNYPSDIYVLIRGNYTLGEGISDGLPYTNTIPGRLKRAQAGLSKTPSSMYYRWAVGILNELFPVAQTMESIKSRAVKRQPKPVEDRQLKYVAPMATFESGKAVYDALVKMTESMRVSYEDSIYAFWCEECEAWDTLSAEEQFKRRQSMRQPPQFLMFRVWAQARNTMHTKMDLSPTYKKTLRSEAERATKDMQQEFVVKNSIKLKSILERKGLKLLSEPKVLNLTVRAGMFSGDMQIVFADGAKFTVRNKVVWKQNHYGTVFNQFPTTFHDVYFANGLPMGAPSEERMNDVFATTK